MAKKDRGLTPEEIERETRKLAADLSFFAKGPVSIQLVNGKHIAYTYNTHKKDQTIPIVMNPNFVADVRNKDRAIQIWRGIGFHELAHHLWPADEQYKAAYANGYGHLMNLVDDEQNERRGRALNPVWGSCFQSVVAHVFPTKGRDQKKVSAGIVDGGKAEKKPRGVAAQEEYARRFNLFAYHFRRHFPDCPDPLVAEALGLIPENFKDISKDELLALVGKIHEIFARDIPLNDTRRSSASAGSDADDDDDEPPKQPEDEKEEEKKDKQKDPDPEDEPPPPDDGWSLSKLLSSRWFWAAFVGFIGLWTGAMLSAGVDFWLTMAMLAIVAVVAIGAFIFLRWRMIKALIANMKSASPPTGPPKEKTERKVTVRGVLGAFVIACTGAGFLALLYFLAGVIGLGPTVLCTGCLVAVVAAVFLMRRRSEAEHGGNKMSQGTVRALVGVMILSAIGVAWSLYVMDFGWQLLSGVPLAIVFSAVMLWVSSRGQTEGSKTAFGKACDRVFARIGALGERLKNLGARALSATGGTIVFVFGTILMWIGSGFMFLWRHGVTMYLWIATKAKRLWWRVEPTALRLWANPYVRLAILALPFAALAAMFLAVSYTAAKISWWVLLILLLLLLLLLFLLWYFRKKIKDFVLGELFMPMPEFMSASARVPLDLETEWFNQIHNIQPVDADHAFVDSIIDDVYPLAQQLRQHLRECGRQTVQLDDQPQGFDLTEEAELVLAGESAIFVDDDRMPKASLHIEVGLDCSGSMASATKTLKPMEKFLLGKFFALVIEQAVINLPGVSARFWGFTGDTIFDCGEAGEGRISGLQCGGGNNDAAMLWHMSQSAAKSGKDVKILLMLSDGQPSDCSWRALHDLVLQLEQDGMIPWNFALDEILLPAFERFFTDLVGQTKEEAIATMGEILAMIAQDGV